MPSARRVTWAKFRVTATAVVALVILGVLAYLLTGGSVLQPRTTLRVYAPDANGIAGGSPVRVNGISVGKVVSVRLSGSRDPNRVVGIVFTVQLEHLREIPDDSTAQISSENVIGDQFLDISKGRSARAVTPGGVIQYKTEPELIKTLDIAQFERNLRGIDALLRDIEEGRGRVGEFVVGDDLYVEVLDRVAGLERGLKAAADTTGPVGQLLYGDELYRRVSEPLRRFDESLAIIQSGQGEAGRLLRDEAAYEQLRSDLAGLRKAVADLNAGRGAAGAFLTSDNLYRQWNARLAAIMRSVDDLNAQPWMTGMSAYESLNGAAREARGLFREFREDPQKYLRIRVF